MYSFNAKAASTEQNKNRASLQAGVYHADVVTAVEKTSKSGNAMVEVTLQLEGSQVQLKEYLVMASNMEWKLEQYLASTGVKFKEGEALQFDPKGLVGNHVVVETLNDRGDKGGLFPKVSRFVQANLQKDVPRSGHVFTAEDLQARGLDADGVSTASAPVRKQEATKGGQQAGSSKAPAPLPNETDDDIPF